MDTDEVKLSQMQKKKMLKALLPRTPRIMEKTGADKVPTIEV